ncbi:MAG: diguanylate cyclase [Candidatus Firestonebacteria bacterium]
MNIYLSSSIIGAIVNLGLSIFVYLKGKGKKINIAFALMSLSVCIWNITTIGFVLIKGENTLESFHRLIVLGIYLIPAFTFHFLTILSKAKGKVVSLLLTLSYILSTGLWISSLLIKTEFKYIDETKRWMPLPNIVSFFFIVIFIFYISYGLYLLFKRYKETSSPLEKTQIRYFLLGISFFFLVSLTSFPHVFWKFKIPPLSSLGCVFYSICVSYSLVRHRLFDIDVVINKIILFIILCGSIIMFYTIFNKLTSSIINPTLANFSSACLIIFFLFFTPLRFWLGNVIDRVVYRNKYDYQNILRNTSKTLVTMLDSEELLNYLTTTVANVVGVRKVCVLLEKTPGNFSIHSSFGLEKDIVKNYSIEVKNGIVGWMKKKKDVFVKEEQERDLPEEEFKTIYKDLEKIGANVSIPLFYKERLLGIATLDSKISGKIYNPVDIDILNTIASQTTIALENARLYNESITDGLTGLHNHKYFIFRLNEEVERARRYKLPLSLLMIDVDHFKNVNDKFGHLAGDMVLRKMGKIIKESTRTIDIPSRYGGEEFAILLLHAKLEGAKVMAYKLNKIIAATEFLIEEKSIPIKITVSIGINSLSEHKKDRETTLDFLKLADIALYKAKENGRNRVETTI